MLDASPCRTPQPSGIVHDEFPSSGDAGLRRPPVIDPEAFASLPKAERRAAQALYAQGKPVTPGAIRHLIEQRAWEGQHVKRRKARLKELKPTLRRATHCDGYRAAAYVHAELQSSGRAPSWRQLRRLMGWPGDAFWLIMERLEQRGWLTYTTEPGSLRPGPRFTEGR